MKEFELFVALTFIGSLGLTFLTGINAYLGKSIFSLKNILNLSKLASISTIFSAIFLFVFWLQNGDGQFLVQEWNGLGFNIRLDILSISMFNMIALLGFFILKFSRTYLQGEQNQDTFIGRLAAALASVQLMVLSGNILLLFATWFLTSYFLHKLLIFYPKRGKAIIAAKKKYITARLSELFLFISLSLLYTHFQTGNLSIILNELNSQILSSVYIGFSAVFLVLAVILKSAQFPFHGWLVEVMETPTPVSALLHAGLINAGPFLMVRFAGLLNQSEWSVLLLVLISGATALYGSLCFTTQTAQKTAMGYSSIAHMGFSLLLSGMGLYHAAMLHLIAHSFYKAHAFLSSGSVIDHFKAKRICLNTSTPSIFKIVAAISLSTLVYFAALLLLDIQISENTALIAFGIFIILGIAQLMVNIFSKYTYWQISIFIIVTAVVITNGFLFLENTAHHIFSSIYPTISNRGTLFNSLLISIVALYSLVLVLQMIGMQNISNRFIQQLGVHSRNGWYINAYFDKMIGSLNVKK